jgi:hypothetical protein
MMMKEVIEEIKRFIDKNEKTDSPLFVYYESIKTNEKGKVLKNTGFLTTIDESIAAKSNNMYVTFYGKEYVCELDMRVWLRGIVPLSEIENLVIFEKL